MAGMIPATDRENRDITNSFAVNIGFGRPAGTALEFVF